MERSSIFIQIGLLVQLLRPEISKSKQIIVVSSF